MAGRSVDVSLVIKAIDQSKSALDTVAKSLAGIAVAQKAVASGSGDTGKALDGLFKNVDELDKVLRNLSGGGDKLAGVYSRQTEALGKATQQIDTYKAKLSELKATQASYQAQLDKSFVGPRLPEVTPRNLRTVTNQIGRIENNSLPTAEAAQARALEAVRQTRDAQRQIAETQNQVSAAIRTSVAEYDRLSAAAKRAAEESARQAATTNLRSQIESLTGVDRAPTPNSLRSQREADLARTFAPVFAAEDAKTQASALKAAADAHAAFEARVKQGKEAMDAEAASMKQLEAYAQGVAESLDPATKTMRLLVEEQSRLTAAVNAGKLTQEQANAAIARYKNELGGQAAAAERASRETESLKTYVQELRRSYDPAGYAAKFLTAETTRLQQAMRKGVIDAQEYEKALAVVKKRSEQLGEKNQVRLLGLEPFQTQNLMFQVNDVVTQLASGTSITQTLAQQGGQILQLFPRIGNAIAGVLTPLNALFAAIVVGFGVTINRALDVENSLRGLQATIDATANSSGSTATGLYDAAKALDRYGLSAEQASEVTKRLFREGFDATQIKNFGTLAKDVADVLGIDFNNALSLVTEAYTGNLDSLEKLMDATDAFTPAQRAAIRELYATGDAAGAASQALGIVSEKFGKAATESESKWTKAIRNFANAWDDLLTYLANTRIIQAAADVINSLAEGMSHLAGETDRAAAAEQRRQQGFSASQSPGNGLTQGPNDPLNQFYGVNPNKTNKGGATGTPDQQAAAEKLTTEMTRQEILAAKVTDQKIIQQKLDVIAAQFNEEYGNKLSAHDLAIQRANKLRIERNKLEEQLAAYQKQQTAERERQNKLENTGSFQAMQLLRQSEGFRKNAYWDVNAFRAGFGSDTVTRADGTVQRVTASTTVSRADAERDLQRRVDDIIEALKSRLGADRFNQFSAKQQGALVSLYYNYGIDSKRLAQELEPALRRGTAEQIAARVRGLANDRPYDKNGKAVNYDRRMREAAILGQPNESLTQGALKATEEQTNAQEKFNQSLDAESEKRRRNYENQKALIGLQGEALLNEQKRQAIAEAIAEKEAEIKRINEDRARRGLDPLKALSDADKARIAGDVGATFDLQTTSVVASELQNKVSELLALRDQIQAQIRSEMERGNANTARQLEGQLGDVNGRLLDASKELYDYQVRNAEALGLSAEQLDTLKLKQDALTESTRQWTSILGIDGQRIANTFTTTMVNAIDQFAQAVASGKDAFSSLWDAFRSFAANFLIQIAQMIQQQIIFNLVSGLLSGFAGGLGGSSTKITTMSASVGLRAHSGGVVGMASTYGRNTGMVPVNPAWFANAMRYHTGGIAGLKPGEVPSILQAGEEVLTRSDPRHVMNGGGAGGGVKIVNTFDHADFFSKGADTRAGEKAILNMVRSNPRAFKQAMSGG